MASLRSMILGGKIAIPKYGPPGMRERYQDRERDAVEKLRSRDTILVDVTSVAQSMQTGLNELSDADWKKQADIAAIPRPKPPYAQMWLEARGGQLHVGFLVERAKFSVASMESAPAILKTATTAVETTAWLNLKGNVLYLGQFVYWLDVDGAVQATRDWTLLEEDGSAPEPQFQNAFRMVQLWLFHAFARMNCRNVKLVPMGTAAVGKPKTNHPPYSVWHEIVVSTKEQLRRELKGEAETAADGEKREVRFHNVRGHYADYTKGAGLFGKYPVLLWIEEHAAGNPELGAAVSTYKIE